MNCRITWSCIECDASHAFSGIVCKYFLMHLYDTVYNEAFRNDNKFVRIGARYPSLDIAHPENMENGRFTLT